MVLFVRKTRLKVGLLVWLTLINLIVFAAFAWESYLGERKALLDGIDSRLRAAAFAVPHVLPPGYHERIVAGEVTEDEFREWMRVLSAYALEADVVYVYSFIVGADGEFRTASTSATLKEWETGDLVQLLDPYDAPGGTRDVLAGGRPQIVEEADQFGDWRSALVPLALADGTQVMVGADVEISSVHELLQRSLFHCIVIAVAGFAFTFALTYVVTSLVARDISGVVRETRRIAAFELDEGPGPDSRILEVDELVRSVEDMKAGLRSFRKFVPAALVRDVLASGQEARLGGQRREVTVFFSDLVNFTTLSEKLPPEVLVAHVGDYLGEVSRIILERRGTVDKFIGDAVMAFWGAPHEDPDQAVHACEAALECRDRLDALSAVWEARGLPPLQARIGLQFGPAIVGNLGSENRLDYTVMGDTVNVASRLEGLNKVYGTGILIGEALRDRLGSGFSARLVDRVAVKGRSEGTRVYELLGRAGVEWNELVEWSERAFEAYAKGDWTAALQWIERIERQRPGDRPARLLAERCRHFQQSPPPPGWDGTWLAGGG